MRTRIKICGITDVETAYVAAECGADAIGLVFASDSPRTITPDAAREITGVLPPFVTSVGVVVDMKPERFAEVADVAGFDWGQLHGKEAEPTVRACGPCLIKAIRYSKETIVDQLRKWSRLDELDAVLIDGGSGGKGELVDWEHLASVQDECDHPIILAGGLTPENVGEAIRIVAPYGVDVSSGVERSPGVKDTGLIAAFCDAVRAADDAARARGGA